MDRYHEILNNDDNNNNNNNNNNPQTYPTIPQQFIPASSHHTILSPVTRRTVADTPDDFYTRPLFLFPHDYPPPHESCHEILERVLSPPLSMDEVLLLQDSVNTRLINDCCQIDSLTKNEAAAVLYYTSENKSNPDLSVYKLINQELLNRNINEEWKKYFYFLTRALEKLPRSTLPFLYRGINVGLTKFKKYNIGNKFVWVTFTSTSEDRDKIVNFSKDNESTCLILETKNGKSISCLSFFPEEKELLLSPNITFVVKEVLSSTMKALLDCPLDRDYLILEEVQSPVSFDSSLINTMTLPNPFQLAFEGKFEQLRDWYNYDPQKSVRIADKQHNDSPLIYTAAVSGNCEMVSWLLEKQADVNARQRDLSTPLHAASYRGNAEMVGLLLSCGADPHLCNRWGKTAYEEAFKHIEIYKSLDQHDHPNVPLYELTCNEIRKYMS